MIKGMLVALIVLIAAPCYAQTVEYIHTDALGSPVVVTDQNRNIVERTEYEPYGRVLTPASPQDGPGYTGHVFDSATGLNYMQQRYYDPGIGMFLSVDPVTALTNPIVQFNRYRYANSNPYRFTDPDGREAGGGYATGQYTMTQPTMTPETAELVGDIAVSAVADLVLGGPSGEGMAIFTGLRAARAADRLNDARQRVQQLEKSRKSFQELIAEHKKKIEDYARNPDAHDNKGTLARASTPEMRRKIIDGRIKALEKQLKKQQGELKKVEEAIKREKK